MDGRRERHRVDAGHHSPEHSAWHKPSDVTGDLPHIPGIHSERDRIGDEMTKAYPGEQDFEIACRLDPRRRS